MRLISFPYNDIALTATASPETLNGRNIP